jgi:hypothetical protein
MYEALSTPSSFILAAFYTRVLTYYVWTYEPYPVKLLWPGGLVV